MKAGDSVKHLPTGETWTLGYVNDGRFLGWLGWPVGELPINQFELADSCSLHDHVKTLRSMLNSDGKMSAMARVQLFALAKKGAPSARRHNFDSFSDEWEKSQAEVGRLNGLLAQAEERHRRLDERLLGAALELADEIASSCGETQNLGRPLAVAGSTPARAAEPRDVSERDGSNPSAPASVEKAAP